MSAFPIDMLYRAGGGVAGPCESAVCDMGVMEYLVYVLGEDVRRGALCY